jgi:hypothetical protein
MAVTTLVSFRLIDDAGRVGHVNLYVYDSPAIADIQTFVTSLAPLLDAVTGARIDNCTVASQLTLPGTLKAEAVANHPISWGANFSFDIQNSQYRWTQHVPAIMQTLLTGDEVIVDAGDAKDYADLMIAGINPALPTDPDGGDLLSLIQAVVSFRKV